MRWKYAHQYVVTRTIILQLLIAEMQPMTLLGSEQSKTWPPSPCRILGSLGLRERFVLNSRRSTQVEIEKHPRIKHFIFPRTSYLR